VKTRVLIADDHALVRRGLRTLLESQPDWAVCGEASNGQEAVEKAKELRPEVVLMDISMPVLNGLEATRQIREALPETEVLVLTMHESREMISAARQAGAGGYVVKSVLERDLIEVMRTIHRHEPCFPDEKGDAPGGEAAGMEINLAPEGT